MVTAREYGDELLRRLLDDAATAAGAVGAGLSLTDGSPRSVAAVGVAGVLDPAQWTVGEGPLWDALRGSRRVTLPPHRTRADAVADARAAAEAGSVTADVTAPETGHEATGDALPLGPGAYPALAQVLTPDVLGDVHGLVATTGEWAGDEPLILVVYLDRPPDDEVVEVVDRYEGLLGTALATVEYCAGEEMRAEQMLQMVQYRRVIEQAKGLVMASVGGDAAAAFATLSRASQHFNLRLRNLAVALVEHVGDAPAEGPDDVSQVVVPTEHDRAVAAQVWRALSARPSAPTAPSGPPVETHGDDAEEPRLDGDPSPAGDPTPAGAQ